MEERSRKLLSFLLGVLVLGVLAYFAGSESISHLKQVSLTSLVLATGVYSLSWVMRAERLSFLLRDSSPGLGKVFVVNLGGYAGNIVLPAKAGDILRALYLDRNGVERPEAFISVFFTRIQDLLAVTVILLVFLPSVWFINFSVWFLLPLALGISFLVSFVALFFLEIRRFQPYFRKLEKLLISRLFGDDYDITSEAFDVFDSYLKPGFSSKVLGMSLLVWVLEVLTAYFIAVRIIPDISVALIFVAVSFGNVAKIVPATPGGVGLYEAAVASVLSVAGVPYSAAFSIALVEHTLKNVFIALFGSYFLSREGINLLHPHV